MQGRFRTRKVGLCFPVTYPSSSWYFNGDRSEEVSISNHDICFSEFLGYPRLIVFSSPPSVSQEPHEQLVFCLNWSLSWCDQWRITFFSCWGTDLNTYTFSAYLLSANLVHVVGRKSLCAAWFQPHFLQAISVILCKYIILLSDIWKSKSK